MTRHNQKLWLVGAAFGLFALIACQSPTTESVTGEATPPIEKVASEAAPEKASAQKPPRTASTPRTVRSPKVTAPVDEIPFEGKRIAIVHTANVIGELEPCG